MKNIGKKVMGAGVATLLVTSVASLNAGAVEVTDYKSYAEAQYIVGTGALGGSLVDPLVDALAENEQQAGDGATGVISKVDTAAGSAETAPEPYYAEGALNALEALTGPLGDALGSTGVGVIGSYAKADKNTSHAASGLITNQGAVNVDTSAPGTPANATLNLTGQDQPLEALAPVANVVVDLGAAASSAKLTGATPTKPDAADVAELDYGITGGGLDIELAVLQTLNVTGILNTLTDIDINLMPVARARVIGIDSITNALANSTANGVSINLVGPDAGLISVDVPTLLASAGVDINDLPRNTALLPEVVEKLTAQVGNFVNTLQQNVIDATGDLAIELTLLTAPPVTIPLGEITDAILQPLSDAVDGIIAQVLDPVLTQLGSVLADVLSQIEDVLDIRVNVQHNGTSADKDPNNYVDLVSSARTGTEGVFAITAMRVELLAAAGGGGLLSLNLANSLVGPDSLNTYDDQTNANVNVNADTTNANANVNQNANANVNLNANGGSADKAVDTLPSTGASNLWPFWLLGLLLVALGTAAMVNEKRRASALLA